ncbi:MAG: serine/threonine protein kinase, partial [Anaerolineae bacterium]
MINLLTPGIALHNRYRIVRLVAQGGMSTVYEAYDLSLNRRCVIKENLDTSPQAQQQFQQEAVLLANLSHPHLPRVTDHFIAPGGRQYLVMDLVEGQDLDEMLSAASRPLPEAQVLAWAAQVMDALEYLHGQQPPVIHRDIKPANVKITPAGKAVLVDFGIAKRHVRGQPTMTGARAYTPGYAPFEQYMSTGQTD